MKVDKDSAYKLIFSVQHHPQLGSLVYPYVVELTAINTLSLTYQKVFSGNAGHYDRLSPKELELIAMLDPIMVERLIKKFSPETKIRPKEYFKKHFDRELFKREIRPFIELHQAKLLTAIQKEEDLLYLADEINPAAQKVELCWEFAKVLYHLRRNEFGTRYFATIKYRDERIPFMKVGARLLSNQPAFLLVQNKLLKFYDFVEGNKLAVFLNRKFIMVKPGQEKDYYGGFVKRLLERSPVYAEGFEIKTEQHQAKPVLELRTEPDSALHLRFKYGDYVFDYDPLKFFHIVFKWSADGPEFIKVKSSQQWETSKAASLVENGLSYVQDAEFASDSHPVNWLRDHRAMLEEAGFQLSFQEGQKYELSPPKISYRAKEELDWFDLEIEVTLGEYKFPFKKLIPSIKSGKTSYRLPNGSHFLIPEEWFAMGKDLQNVRGQGKGFHVAKYQLEVLQHIRSKKIKGFLEGIKEIRDVEPSKDFKGELRPYQKAGLSWLMFLYENSFGGILADDMGLGKTVQTLAYLQLAQEQKEGKDNFLLVAPTSLLYNWQSEAQRFCPSLKVYVHAGAQRIKRLDLLQEFDLIITSYGLIRNDFELFEEMNFHCLVLDESQYIKNQSAKSTQLINKLSASHKLCLTGTPVENSIRDLWSQMNFANKGLLKSARQFEQDFVKPIEKERDKDKAEELRKLVHPFVLRRTKSQVAKDLPALIEKTVVCSMSKEQEKRYEEIKSEYRNQLLGVVEEEGIAKNKLSILQGLTKLRLMADHPRLIDPEYIHDSGKHQSILEHIETVVKEGHKVLVFSQFVSYLNILEKDLNAMGLPHLVLTGSVPSPERRKRVQAFQEEDHFSVFLISLKAGGVGLNLTAADYVFIADPWWNPATEAQARDRTHRIGQTRNVMSYKFISSGTIEEKILQLQERKKGFANQVIQLEESMLKSLDIEELKKLFS